MLDIQVKNGTSRAACNGSSKELTQDVMIVIRTIYDGLRPEHRSLYRAAITGFVMTDPFWDIPVDEGTKIEGPAAKAACQKIFSEEA